MSPGLHPFADPFVLARLERPLERPGRERPADERLDFKIALLPLIGLAVGAAVLLTIP